MRRRMIIFAPLAILGALLFVAVGGAVVLLLWNWLLPPLLGWRAIGFWQAVGLLALCRLLFGGLGLRGSARSGGRRRAGERREPMTPEDRERCRQRLGSCWG